MIRDKRFIQKRNLYYLKKDGKKIQRFKPWLGDAFSFLYDRIMEKSIFPKKFGGDILRHLEILSRELKLIKNSRILELGTGSGSAAQFLDNSNHYTGSDISPGLLKIAVKRFSSAGFQESKFFVVGADVLPFDDQSFDVCLCILSFNFFNDAEAVISEIKRVLHSGGVFFCSVPVPERKERSSPIRGTLYSEKEFETMFQEKGFDFKTISAANGALLYFKAVLR